MKLTHKIAAGFAAVIILVMVVGGFGWFGIGALTGFLGAKTEIAKLELSASETAAEIERGAAQNDPALLAEAEGDIQSLESAIDGLLVEMKDPGSISLSLPVMRAAREVLVAACGVSEKYPQGKSDAMKRAVETEESVRDFPAAGLRDVAQYVFDEAAASKLTL